MLLAAGAETALSDSRVNGHVTSTSQQQIGDEQWETSTESIDQHASATSEELRRSIRETHWTWGRGHPPFFWPPNGRLPGFNVPVSRRVQREASSGAAVDGGTSEFASSGAGDSSDDDRTTQPAVIFESALSLQENTERDTALDRRDPTIGVSQGFSETSAAVAEGSSVRRSSTDELSFESVLTGSDNELGNARAIGSKDASASPVLSFQSNWRFCCLVSTIILKILLSKCFFCANAIKIATNKENLKKRAVPLSKCCICYSEKQTPIYYFLIGF